MNRSENKMRNSISPSEKFQMENLRGYNVICNKPETVFDQLAAFTATMLNTPIAIINFVDQNEVWSKIAASEMQVPGFGRDKNLCSLAIKKERANKYEHIAAMPGLMSNALIAGEMGMKFYAAVPIITDEGLNIGSVCIVDDKSRVFLPQDQRTLERIAAMVKVEMNKKITDRIYA